MLVFLRFALCICVSLTTANMLAAEPAGPSKFDGKRSYGYLRDICALGNRKTGSKGMLKQQDLLKKHFEKLGVEVEYQKFMMLDPLTRKQVPVANIIVSFFPERKERILMCAHYDTRPFPDEDPDPRKKREGLFLGANDGASGVAVLMELANHVKTLPDRYGLDFVFFDAEELIYGRRGEYFVGSKYFAQNYVDHKPDFEYVAGVLLDMVGDTKLTIFQEQHSVAFENTRPIVQGIWGTAARLGVTEFIPRVGYDVQDDHLPLNRIANIPTIDVIDFHYPEPSIKPGGVYWHTTNDTPGRCSADSLGKVGTVMLEWLRSAED
jgi:glutaminyl-peptide cyclotransferase